MKQTQNFIEVTLEKRGFSFLPCTCYVAQCMGVAQKARHSKIAIYAIFGNKKCATKVRFTWRSWLNCIVLDRNCLYLKEFSYWNNFYYCEIQIANRGWPKAANNTVTQNYVFFFFPHFITTHNSGKKFSARKRAEIFLTPLSCVMICQNPPPPPAVICHNLAKFNTPPVTCHNLPKPLPPLKGWRH